MKLFGHKSFFSKVGHAIDDGINNVFNEANKFGKKIFGNNSWYAGTNGIYVGDTAEQIMANKLPNGGRQPQNQDGYSRTTAATAKDIAQGGMTKDEVIEFNMKHPNETALGR